MKLTNKDKEFLDGLRALLEQKQLHVDLTSIGPKRMILRKNYGDKIDQAFGITRQGVRWRFQRLLNQIYVSAYETIYFVETRLGSQLRPMALEIAKERVEMRRKAQKMSNFDLHRRESGTSEGKSGGNEL